MVEEVIIFNKVNSQPDFNYTGAQICRWSGLEKSLVSRFLNGKTDISLSKFFQLIRSMPAPFQEAYWAEVLKLEHDSEIWRSQKRPPWTSLISKASYADIEEILNALANRWTELGKVKEKEALAA